MMYSGTSTLIEVDVPISGRKRKEIPMYPYVEEQECTICKKTADRVIFDKQTQRTRFECSEHGDTIVTKRVYFNEEREDEAK